MRRMRAFAVFVGLVASSALAAPGDQEGGKDKDHPGEGAKPEGGKGDDKGGQERKLAEIDKHIQEEVDKHAERVAKIDRLVELNGAKKDEKSAADLKDMREKEDARHDKAMKRLQDQRARVVEGKDAGDDDKDKPGHDGPKDKDKDHGKGEEKAKDKDHDKDKKDKDDGGDQGKDKHGKKDKDDDHGKGGK